MVNERFIELLAKKLSDEIDEREAEELKYLLASDEECLRQYDFFKTYWIQNEEQYSNGDLMFQKIKSRIGVNDNINEELVVSKGIKRISWFWRSAAAVLLIGISVYIFNDWTSLSSKKNVVTNLEVTEIPSRVKSKITLSDGTVITLNSQTTLKYPAAFEGQTREVYLNGEAFFDVAKDHKHPFIVHAGNMSVRVLGTAFNIKSYSNDARSETTLIRGTIEVTLADRPSDRIILKPNEKLILNSATVGKRSVNNDVITAPNPDTVHTNYTLTNLTYLKPNDTTVVETSWVNNRLVFKDETFGEIAKQMARWYGLKIEFKNDKVKEYRFTGVFEKETLVEALVAFKKIETFNYKFENETLYIY